jgi:hypothetical protein
MGGDIGTGRNFFENGGLQGPNAALHVNSHGNKVAERISLHQRVFFHKIKIGKQLDRKRKTGSPLDWKGSAKDLLAHAAQLGNAEKPGPAVDRLAPKSLQAAVDPTDGKSIKSAKQHISSCDPKGFPQGRIGVLDKFKGGYKGNRIELIVFIGQILGKALGERDSIPKPFFGNLKAFSRRLKACHDMALGPEPFEKNTCTAAYFEDALRQKRVPNPSKKPLLELKRLPSPGGIKPAITALRISKAKDIPHNQTLTFSISILAHTMTSKPQRLYSLFKTAPLAPELTCFAYLAR